MKGFTLIELIVVIAIIGLLSSIIISRIRGVGCTENCENTPVAEVRGSKEWCMKRAEYNSVKDLPAICLHFFSGN